MATPPAESRIELCGELRVEQRGRRLEAGLPGRQGRLLFAYLVLNRSRPVSRDELIAALWWNAPPAAPGSALSALLSRLRSLLGAGRLEGRGELRLVLPAGADVDVEAAERAAARAESAAASGEFGLAWDSANLVVDVAERVLLPGHDAPWLDERRRDLEELALGALECMAQAGVALGGSRLALAERALRRLIDGSPYRETAYGRLMEILEARGDIAEALRVYERLRQLLREELGTAPAPMLQALHTRLLHAGDAQLPATPDPRTLGNRVLTRDRIRFVGRRPELELFDRLFVDDPPLSVVHVHGPAGIGKSTLLREVARRGRERGWTPQLVEGRDLLPVPDALEQALDGARDEQRPLLLFDTYERMQAIDGHLRRRLVPSLPERAIVVIAGRRPPACAWFQDGWENVTAELELERLSRDEALQLLRAHGIGAGGVTERILARAGGSPLALSLAAAGSDQALARRLTEGELDVSHRAALGVAAIARVTTPELLEAALPDADPAPSYRWLASRTFAEPVAEGLTLHELVRKGVRADLRRREPDFADELRCRIADHLHERAAAGRPALTIDLAELVDNELIRWGYGWEGSADYRIDALRAGDVETVGRLLGRRDHSEWWDATRPFFEDAGERVAVARDSEDRLCGYVIAVTTANAPAFAAADPLLGGWLRHARAHDHNAVLFRDSIDFTTDLSGDPGSRAQAMLNLAGILRSGLANPRVAYLPVNPLNVAAKRFVRTVGAVHVSELDVKVGRQSFECHLLDHGPGGVLGLQRDVIYHECGLTPPSQLPREVAS